MATMFCLRTPKGSTRTALGQIKFQCEECEFCENKESMAAHIDKKHSENIECGLCDITFQN